MTSAPVVAIEGLPFAGKTSGLQAALDHLPHWVVIEEYHDLLSRDDLSQFATTPGSASSQADRIDTYFQLDLLRWNNVTAAQSTGTPVVLDRYHLSIITYSQALHDCFGLGEPTDVADRYRRAVEDPMCPITRPDAVIFAEVSLAPALDRLHAHSTMIGPDLSSSEFVACLIGHYASAVASIVGDVHRIDADKPLDHVHDRIHQILRGLS